MKRVYILIAIILSACQTSGPRTIDRTGDDLSTAKPGTIVVQSIRQDLGNGFYNVSKSVINHPDHWEGIGHFGYLYFHKTEVCKCSVYNTSISPDGTYVVYFSHKTKKLVIYNTRSKDILVLSDKYIGYPKSTVWDLQNKSAVVLLSTPNDELLEKLSISLK